MDWATVFRGLMEMLGKTAAELNKMTLSEICVATIDIEKEVKGEKYDEADTMAYFEWWESLTDEDKIRYGGMV